MGSHDVNLVEAEAEDDVHGHVEGKPRQDKMEQARVAAVPYSGGEKQHYECLDNVADSPSVAHEHGTCLLHVLEKMVAVELERLAEEVLGY